MPGNSGTTAKELVRAVRAGKLDEKVLDQRIDEILTVMLPVHKRVEQRKRALMWKLIISWPDMPQQKALFC